MTNGYGTKGDFDTNQLMTASEAHARGNHVLGAIAKSVEPTPPMQSEVRNLERSIHRLDAVLSQLAGRMEPVCRTEPPSPRMDGATEARARAASGLGSQIASYADQIDGLSSRVTGLLQRCEL